MQPKRLTAWRIALRATVPALLLAVWINSMFGEVSVGRRWTKGFPVPPSPPAPGWPPVQSCTQEGWWQVRSSEGAARLLWGGNTQVMFRLGPPTPPTTQWSWTRATYSDVISRIAPSIFGLKGFWHAPEFFIVASATENHHASIPVPYFLLTSLAAIPLLRLLWANRRSVRRNVAGLCRECDYDLRAHQAGARCPECGTVI